MDCQRQGDRRTKRCARTSRLGENNPEIWVSGQCRAILLFDFEVFWQMRLSMFPSKHCSLSLRDCVNGATDRAPVLLLFLLNLSLQQSDGSGCVRMQACTQHITLSLSHKITIYINTSHLHETIQGPVIIIAGKSVGRASWIFHRQFNVFHFLLAFSSIK